MDSYGEFKKEVLKVDSMWELFKPYEGFQKLYIKFMYQTRLICRVLKKLRIYKRKTIPLVKAVETILEPNERIEVINTIRKYLRLIHSIKIKCKL